MCKLRALGRPSRYCAQGLQARFAARDAGCVWIDERRPARVKPLKRGIGHLKIIHQSRDMRGILSNMQQPAADEWKDVPGVPGLAGFLHHITKLHLGFEKVPSVE